MIQNLQQVKKQENNPVQKTETFNKPKLIEKQQFFSVESNLKCVKKGGKKKNRLRASERSCRVHYREEWRFDPSELPLLCALLQLALLFWGKTKISTFTLLLLFNSKGFNFIGCK